MSNPLLAERKVRLYLVLVEWFEEQVRSGALRPGDRLPPERKLGEQFGISRTAVREALRSLAARGLIESHVGRGTFVRQPAVEHLSQKLQMLHGDEQHRMLEALVHVVASLAHLAAERRTDEQAAKLKALAEHAAAGEDNFLHCLGEAADNSLMGTLARALAHALAPLGEGLARRMNTMRVAGCILERKPEKARIEVLNGFQPART